MTLEPYFELSKKKVMEQYHKVKKICGVVSYSSKTNPDVAKILEEETGCLFSVHLENELKNIKDHSRVLFLAQGWDQDQIRRLLGSGLKRFVVDNEVDLDILLDYLKEKNPSSQIDLMLRVKLKENSIKTERYFVFGMRSDTVNKRITEISEDSTLREHIDKLGIHFHRKTQNMSEWKLKYELQDLFPDDVLQKIDYLNIGGGLPSVYANTNINLFDSIFTKISEVKSWLNDKNIKLMIEPGRFISAPAAKLVTYIKRVYENNIIVNASVYNSDMDAILVPVKLLVKGELERGQGKPYVIKGVTPCSMDLFRYRVYLKEPKVGDKIIFLNAGAYNFSSDFCNLKKLETRFVT